MSDRTRRRRSSSRRESSREAPSSSLLDRQRPHRVIHNKFPPLDPMSEDQLEKIHHMSMRILEEQGLKVLSADARRRLASAGAEVDDGEQMVKMDRSLVMDLVSKAPAKFTLTPRNPDNVLELGGNTLNFGMVSGPPNVHDMVRGRRQGNFADYCELVKLAQCFNIITFYGNQTIAPVDLAVNTRHLDTYLACIKYNDKVFSSMSIGSGRVRDAAQMLAIARGLSLEELASSPSAITNISVNSP